MPDLNLGPEWAAYLEAAPLQKPLLERQELPLQMQDPDLGAPPRKRLPWLVL